MIRDGDQGVIQRVQQVVLNQVSQNQKDSGVEAKEQDNSNLEPTE